MSVATDALLLREWALGSLFTSRRLGPPVVSDEAWQLFLMMECCALPLQKRHRNITTFLETVARRETVRVESVHEQIALLRRLAKENNLKIVLLKGATSVIAGLDLHIEDVDVLCSPEDAAVLAANLKGSWSGSTFATAPDDHDFRIDVHRCDSAERISMLDAAVPAPAAPGLFQLTPRDHLWYVLSHSVQRHPDRIARVRDLILIQHAMRDCSVESFRDVVRCAERTEECASMLAVLFFLRDRDTRRLSRVERYVRRRYFMLAHFRGLGRNLAGQSVLTCAAWLTAWPWQPALRVIFEPAEQASRFRGLASLYDHAPRLERAIRITSRLFVLIVAAALTLTAFVEERARFGFRRSAPVIVPALARP